MNTPLPGSRRILLLPSLNTGVLRKEDHVLADPVAQLVEHDTFNVGVLGSSPSGITRGSLRASGGFLISRRSGREACPATAEAGRGKPQRDHGKKSLGSSRGFLVLKDEPARWSRLLYLRPLPRW